MSEKTTSSSTVENLQKSREQREHFKKIGLEKIEQYKTSLNSVASTEHGRFFLKSLIRSLKPFDPINIKGDVDAVVQRNVYLEKIRPYLDSDIRKELEND
jgi:hypothetical protein